MVGLSMLACPASTNGGMGLECVSPEQMAVWASQRVAVVNGGIVPSQHLSRHCRWRNTYVVNSVGGSTMETDPLRELSEKGPLYVNSL